MRGNNHISDIVKIHYFFKNLLLYFKAQVRQTEGIVMMSKEGSTKIVNFMTPRAGILVLGCGLYKLCSENALFLEESPSFNSGIDQTN